MAKLGWKRNVNVSRVVSKIVMTVIALYVGGFLMTQIGTVMNGTCSPFYKGLSLIGYTVGSHWCHDYGATHEATIHTTGSSGILAVVGIIAIASIVTEFVQFSM